MSKDKKVARLGDILGVGKRQAYAYLAGLGMPHGRAQTVSNVLGGHVMLWIESGGRASKRKLFDDAAI